MAPEISISALTFYHYLGHFDFFKDSIFPNGCLVFHCVAVAYFPYPVFIGHSGCLQILGIWNSAPMNIKNANQILLFVLGPPGYVPRSGVDGANTSSIFNLFYECPYCFSEKAGPVVFQPTG